MNDKPKKQSLLQRSQAKKFVDDGKIPNDDVMLTIGGKKVGSLGNFIALSGKQKSRKTAYLGALMASGITGDTIISICCDLPAGKNELLHIDTEQSEYDYKMSLDRMKRIGKMKKIPKTFNSYRFRDWTNVEIKGFVDEYLEENRKTGLIIIDGIIDLVMDFNSIEECKVLIDWLKMITDKFMVLVVCIIHRSKTQNFSLGHLGSFIDRFAQSALEVYLGFPGEDPKKVNRNVSTLAPEYMRSDGEFEPISITYDTATYTWKQLHNS